MFTHSPPFWYRPSAPAPPSILEELFIFDDVKTGSTVTLETLTTQYPTLTISSNVGGGFQGMRDMRPLFSGSTATSIANTFPDSTKPVQLWLVSDGSTPCFVDLTFQRGYTHCWFYYLAGGSFVVRFFDESNTVVLVLPIDAVSGLDYFSQIYVNMPVDGGGNTLKFVKMRIFTLMDNTILDSIYVRTEALEQELLRFDEVAAGTWGAQYPTVTVTGSAPNLQDPTTLYSPAATNWPVNGGRRQCTLFSDGNFTLTFQRDYKYIKFDYLAKGWTMQLLDNSNNVLASFTPATLSGNTYVLGYAQNWAAGFRKVKFIVANGGIGFAIDNIYVRTAVVE